MAKRRRRNTAHPVTEKKVVIDSEINAGKEKLPEAMPTEESSGAAAGGIVTPNRKNVSLGGTFLDDEQTSEKQAVEQQTSEEEVVKNAAAERAAASPRTPRILLQNLPQREQGTIVLE